MIFAPCLLPRSPWRPGQAACTALDIPANAAVAADLVRRAADQGTDLLVLPELFPTGYELPAIVADPETYTLSSADLRLDPLATACAETRTALRRRPLHRRGCAWAWWPVLALPARLLPAQVGRDTPRLFVV
jgi:hypothetical protein